MVQSHLVPSVSLRERLIEREQRILAEAERMQTIITTSKQVLYGSQSDYGATIRSAKKHLKALMAGLVPVRIVGKYFNLSQLLEIGIPVPTEIVEQADRAVQRLPGGKVKVYGLENAVDAQTGRTVAAEIRRRDPVLTYRYGEQEFFLGFWLEVDTDLKTPEFFGIRAPWAEKRPRGRPRKMKAIRVLMEG